MESKREIDYAAAFKRARSRVRKALADPEVRETLRAFQAEMRKKRQGKGAGPARAPKKRKRA